MPVSYNISVVFPSDSELKKLDIKDKTILCTKKVFDIFPLIPGCPSPQYFTGDLSSLLQCMYPLVSVSAGYSSPHLRGWASGKGLGFLRLGRGPWERRGRTWGRLRRVGGGLQGYDDVSDAFCLFM